MVHFFYGGANINFITNMTDTDINYGVDIDNECLTQDFDEIDLYAERMVGDDDCNSEDCDILFE